MEIEQIIKLVNTVSASRLSEFSYSENGVNIAMKKKEKAVTAVTAAPVREIISMDQEEALSEEPEGNIVKSPLVGTFYSAPSEDAQPFVKEGDHVKKGQTLAIVEAMKLMNEIESDWDGTVTRIMIKNGESVEYGQPLFCIE